MPEGSSHPDAKPFLEAMDEAEKQLIRQATYLNRVKARIQKAKKAIAAQSSIVIPISSLLDQLNDFSSVDSFSVHTLAGKLQGHLRELKDRLRDAFGPSLRRECETRQLSFKQFQDGFGVGPFKVVVNKNNDVATVQYAKIDLAKGVPLDPLSIVEGVVELNAVLLATPTNLAEFARQLEEAMRVSNARLRRSSSELRVDLPLVYREMVFIRQSIASENARPHPYILPRFIIELKTLVQSEQNLNGVRQFRVEPAVLENANNPKKSVFIPNDLNCGYGEGTHCQAITFREIR